MTTITIPKQLARAGDLVLIPRKKYQALLKKAQEEHLTVQQRKIVDAAITEGLADIEAGRTHGPFSGVGAFHTAAKKLAKK